MRRKIVLVAAVVCALSQLLLSQTWTWESNKPQGNTLNDVVMTSSADGWAVGDMGTILRYRSGEWVEAPRVSKEDIYAMYFHNENSGWAVGQYGTVLRYVNGRWIDSSDSYKYASDFNTTLIDIAFLPSGKEGWVLGYKSILHFKNNVWHTDSNPAADNMWAWFSSITILDSNNAWICGKEGTLLKYNGSSWFKVTTGTTNDLNKIVVVDNRHGWAAGNSGVLLKYNGTSWTAVSNPAKTLGEDIVSLFMVDSVNGWATTSGPGLMKCTNGVWASSPDPVAVIKAVSITSNGSMGCMVGENGVMMKYEVNNWKPINNGINATILTSIVLTDTLNGWAAGGSDFYKYNGVEWSAVSTPAEYSITNPYICVVNALAAISKNDIWAAGSQYTLTGLYASPFLMHYNGTAWSKVTPTGATDGLKGVSFTDSRHGWAVGFAGTMIKYNGSSWSKVTGISDVNDLNAVCFPDTNHGWIVGDSGVIITYSHGVWSKNIRFPRGFSTSAIFNGWTATSFIDSTEGWIGGDGDSLLHFKNGVWTSVKLPENGSGINHISIFDSNHGIAVGYHVVYLWDGISWKKADVNIGHDLQSAFMVDSLHGWVAGGGAILKYSKNSGSAVENRPANKVMNTMLAAKTNPFNSCATLVYYVPKSAYVDLSLFTVDGKKVRSIVQENKTSGYHTAVVAADRLSAGVYMCKLTAGKENKVIRLILAR